MKIGIMLRHYDQHGGGVKVYTKGLLRELFKLKTDHQFLLIYQNPDLIGSYSSFSHVKETATPAKFKITWDQLAVQKIIQQERLDLIFNPKYSLPIFTKCKAVYVCHGLDWYVMPWGSKWLDRLSHKYLIPLYAKKANAIIAVSEITRQHVIKYLKVPSAKVHTIHLGLDEIFREPITPQQLEETRNRYKLPDQYFLYCGQIYPPKNFGRLLKAYAKVGPKQKISLVVAGEHRWLCGEEYSLIEDLGITDWVVRPGWIERETLPALYAMAEALLMPSLYEACPSPPIEAMAQGCPVVTANRYGTKEVAGNAAVLVEPESVDDIARGIKQIVTDKKLREELIRKGLKRSQNFSWKKCAKKTIGVIDTLLK